VFATTDNTSNETSSTRVDETGNEIEMAPIEYNDVDELPRTLFGCGART
jgi:hypothetical protein